MTVVANTPARDYALIDSIDAAKELAERLMDEKAMLGFDVETGYTGDPFVKRSLDTSHAAQFVCGFSITNNPAWARYIALRHDGAEENLPPREIWEIFRRPLQELEIVAHHKKFEDKNLLVLPSKGDASEPIRTLLGHDSMLEAYVLGRWKENGLKFLTDAVFGYHQTSLNELFLKVTGKELSAVAMKKMRFNVLPVVPDVIDYGCDDSVYALQLHEHFMKMFESEPERRRNILRIEREISAIMADVELYGVGVDWEGMERGFAQYEGFKGAMHEAVIEEFEKYTDRDVRAINFASPQQMRQLLYGDLGLTTTRLTGTKELSTDKIALEALQKENSAVKRMLESREVIVLGTRHKKWLTETANAPDKRGHASYSQVTVPTGRFSASDPAIQQLPKTWFWSADPSVTYSKKSGVVNPNGLENGKDYWYGNFREYIIAAPDHYLLTYDVSQGELRVLAGVSQESRLLEAYQNDEDVHTLTAAMMLGKEPEDLEGDERQIGKALPNTELVLTPKGFVPMGSIKVGDTVVTPTGTANVHGVYPQGVRKTYTVRMTDGGRVRADGEHLWKVVGVEELKTTDQLQAGDAFPTAAWEPQYPTKPLVDAYTMGVLLAGASLTGTAIRMDLPVDVEGVLGLCNFGTGVSYRLYRERNRKGRNEYVITAGKAKSREFTEEWTNPLEAALKYYEHRFYRGTTRVGRPASEKFVPSDYMNASYADRLAFLQGLLDVKGRFAHSHSIEFEAPNFGFASQVREIVWSLGGRAKISTRRSSWGERGKGFASTGYWVHISMEETPFRLLWKASKYTKGLPTLRTVQAVTESDEEECTCIALDDGIGLFVTSDYIVTHNTMNFALLYQMGVQSLSERLAIPLHKAEELYANYFKQFTSVNAWIEKTKREGMTYGYAETFMGRRVPLWGYDSPKWGVRSAAERASVNYPIQGGLADIVKVIMVRSAYALKKAGLWNNGVMITMNQHDALTFECHNSLNPNDVRELLNDAANFELKNFPNFVFDWEIGQRWGSSKPWKWGQEVRQDEKGYWDVVEDDKPVEAHVEAKVDTVVIEPSEPQFIDPPALIVSVERKPSLPLIQEFFQLVKDNPGDTEISLTGPGLDYTLPVKTSLTIDDAPRISLALGGANVRIPETSTSLITVGADINYEGV